MTEKKEDEKAPEKPLTIKKETVKDLTVQPDKEDDVVGGGGGSPSKPRTPNNYTCSPC
ncbi:MAG: hypothetical protein IT186_02985 [Acidobacteria bacterium]|nr:hypothetical protein [Acidobacteriota bacterium]